MAEAPRLVIPLEAKIAVLLRMSRSMPRRGLSCCAYARLATETVEVNRYDKRMVGG
jgi:hypothetical protein